MSFNARYKKALNEVRATTPDAGEIQKAIQTFGPPARRGFRFARVGGLAVAAGLILGAVTLLPTQASAFERMKQALKSVPASHTVYFGVDGKVTQEFWREGVKRRYRSNFEMPSSPDFSSRGINDRGYDGEVVWVLWNDGNATVGEEEPDGFGFESTSVEEMVKAYEGSDYLAEPLKVMQTGAKGGSTVITVEGRPKTGHPFRQVYHCRASDGLPTRVESFGGVNGKAVGVSEISYPADLKDDIFKFKPRPGDRVADHREAKRAILDGIRKPDVTRTIGGVTISVLGAFEDKDGSVFVLWTGGARPHLDGRGSIAGQVRSLVSYPYLFDRDLEAVAPADVPVSKKHPAGLIGQYDYRPYTIETFSTIGTTPVYAMQATVNPSKVGRDLEVSVPVFKEGPARTLRYGQVGAWFQSPGTPVGVVRCTLKTMPVDYMYGFMKSVTSVGGSSWGGAPQNPF